MWQAVPSTMKKSGENREQCPDNLHAKWTNRVRRPKPPFDTPKCPFFGGNPLLGSDHHLFSIVMQ
jgi:hypothetical protein